MTLIGLAAKNAILIVEYAKERREHGMSVVDSALDAAHLRLRPILMTSFAFILGVVPLVIATGAGANSRRALGTAVFGGMNAATLLAIFAVPVCFVVVSHFAERRRPQVKEEDERTGGSFAMNRLAAIPFFRSAADFMRDGAQLQTARGAGACNIMGLRRPLIHP